MWQVKSERLWLRIIVSVIAGGIAGFASYAGCLLTLSHFAGGKVISAMLVMSIFLIGPAVTTGIRYALTQRETKDGHTRCGKCGYILKGLTEPRCSECGERI